MGAESQDMHRAPTPLAQSCTIVCGLRTTTLIWRFAPAIEAWDGLESVRIAVWLKSTLT
jgi:hypothetical protein